MNTSFEAGLKRILESKLVGIVFVTPAGLVTRANETFLEMVGYQPHETLNLHEITPPEHHQLDREALEKLSAFGSVAPYEKELFRKDGTRISVMFTATVFQQSEQELVCLLFELTQQKQAQKQLTHLAYHDSLTDLPNQGLFKDRLKQAIALARRRDEMQAVLLLNLDRFKTINDSLGYNAGDQVLKSVAQRLSSCVRGCDTVARFGSDEFAILLTHINRHQHAANVARSIKEALNQAFLLGEQELFLSTSIGISIYPEDGRDTPTLLKSAGTALERAKEKGGNNHQFYTAGRTTYALKQLVLESNLRSGLERNEFIVEYQPLVDVKDFRLVGMEALVRWQHPVMGLLYPSEFIQLAEDSGLMVQIGDWSCAPVVCKTSCGRMPALNRCTWRSIFPRGSSSSQHLCRAWRKL